MAIENEQQNSTAGEREQGLFYNVMPRGGSNEPMTVVQQSVPAGSAAIKLPNQTPANAIPLPQGKHKSRAVLIITPIVIILLAVAGYSVWLMQKGNSDEQSTAPIDVKNEEKSANQEEETPPLSSASKEWLLQFFGSASCTQENICGDNSDPDRDGLTNKEEYGTATDPNNSDSDSDGLADGDEFKVFASNPSKAKTAGDAEYDDSDYAKGGYDTSTKKLFVDEKLVAVKANMKANGLHQPTLTSLGDSLLQIYGFTESDIDPTPKPQGSEGPEGFENTPEAKLDRDAQRLETIKKIGAALVKFKSATGKYPEASDIGITLTKVAPYLTSATNTKDPIDKAPFVYGYIGEQGGGAFSLSYYSETQSQLIRYRSTDAESGATEADAETNDEQRIADLEAIQSALLIYSASKITPESVNEFVFPKALTYKAELAPTYISSMPKDPKTGKDYEYKVSEQFNSFTVRAVLEKPSPGTTGFLCNQEECREY